MNPRTPEPPDFPASQLFLRRLAFHLVRDEARAEDLVQDTWAAWIEHRPSGVAEPRAWLARVLRNRAFNAQRTDERRARREELAGRPDPSDPETEGTLEAQAQLLEALRKLEEPYRSTLVQRYYHDLAPKEIAGRTGTPLNTVKARLARGLEKLRGAMDRRYHGDRRAWCHWLTVVGAPPVGVQVPSGAGPAASVGGGAGSSVLAWTGVALLLVAGAAWMAEWSDEPRRLVTPPPSLTTRIEAHEPTRLPVPSEPGGTTDQSRESITEEEILRATVRASKPRPRAAPAPEEKDDLRLPFLRPFDWPQYAGGPAHDTYRARADGITRPHVRWFLPALAGPPSLMDGDLYSGGVVLAQVDPRSGECHGVTSPLLHALLRSDHAKSVEHGRQELVKLVEQRRGDSDAIGGAPVVTPRSVIVRSLADGAVLAYDRPLERELWRFEIERGPHRPEHARVPMCLVADTLIVVAGRQILALDEWSGQELWRFSCNGTIRMVPASAGGRVFFGMDRGELFALSLSTGERLWSASAGTFSTTPPAVLGENLYLADRGNLPWRAERGDPGAGPRAAGTLRLFDARSGTEIWTLGFKSSPLSPLGFADGGQFAFAAWGGTLGRVELTAGRLPQSAVLPTREAVVGTPAVVGANLVYACEGGELHVRNLETLALRWSFHAEGAEIEDFVHAGEQLYVATSIGLFCLGNGPEGPAPEPGFVLEWDDDVKGSLSDFGR